MYRALAERRDALAALCRRFGVARLDVFGSAARGADFDPASSDADFLVEFDAHADDLGNYLDFKEALERLLDRPVDLVDRRAVEESRNYIRRRRILAEAVPVYG